MKPKRIQALSSMVANQIAAGEVIERPASIVKELLENALDAGADTIQIDIGFGGLNYIKVSDNGSGIFADDLPLAIAAHATSKITQLQDLYAITSMGFRGEALASIAAVSRLSILSKPGSQAHAVKLTGESSHYEKMPCARSDGTTVEVRDLFFNAPVRKQFLKTARSEYQAIELVIKRFALSAPSIALFVKHNEKQTLALPAATNEQTNLLRIKKLLGKAFLDHAIFMDVEQGGLRLRGWLSGLAYQRSQTDKQWFYLNQRMVKDKLINHAIKQTYESLLHPGRHPACLLYLTVSPNEVDVNVHPTKHEVRFQQPRLVHDFITTQLARALNTTDAVETIALTDKPDRRPMLREPSLLTAWTSGTSSRQWQILNSHFILAWVNEVPYLIDVSRLQQRYFSELYGQLPFPLSSRMLLVPVRYPIEVDGFERHQFSLEQIGIQFDWVDAKTIVVRTLPECLPQLDTRQLLTQLGEKVMDPSDMLQLAIASQACDAYQLHTDDLTSLMDYFKEQLPMSDSSAAIRLDLQMCRAILDV